MALLIYKQWHRNANKPKTPESNSTHIKYIGERVHVLKDEKAENGLFGRIGGKDIEKISTADAMNYVEKFSKQKKTMFRSCISFTPERAELLGLTSKKNWEKYIRYHAYTLASKNKIDLKDFEYLAAVHDKKGQPHIHIAFWNKNQKVGINYVNPEIPNEIRDTVEIDSFGELAEEMQEDYENPASNSEFTIDNGNEIRKELISKTFKNEKDALHDVQNKLFEAFAKEGMSVLPPTSDYQKLAEDFAELADTVQEKAKKGKLVYGFMKPEIKEQIDGVSDEMMKTFPDLKELFNDYVLSKRTESEMYNSTDSNIGAYEIAKAVGKAKDELYRKLGNEILRAVKKYNMERRIAASQEEFQKRQGEIRQQQSERLVLSVLRVLKEFSKEGQSDVAAASKEVFGRGDLSRAAILDLVNKNRDNGQEM